MADDELLSAMIDDIRKLELCNTIYEFFAMLYHIANKYSEHLTNRCGVDVDEHYGLGLSNIEVIRKSGDFLFYEDILVYINKIQEVDDAVSLIIALISKIDTVMAGIVEHYDEAFSSLPERNWKRLGNPAFYVPIKIPHYNETYMIAPYIEPVYFQWVNSNGVLDRDTSYLSQTIDHCFFKHHTIIGYKGKIINTYVKFVNENSLNSEELNEFYLTLESIARTGSLAIALASHDSGFRCAFYTWVEGKTHFFRVTDIELPAKQKIKNKIEDVMSDALVYNVDILIFPEMVVDSDSLSVIAEWLDIHNTGAIIKMVVAGSFHYMDKGEHSNKSVMLDYSGSVVWEQRKLHRFIIKANDMNTALQGLLKLHKKVDVQEAIDVVDPSLKFIDTPIGRMATMICVDYLETTLHPVFNHIKCGFLWLPAMTTSIEKFETSSDTPYSSPYKILSAVCAGQSMCGMSRVTSGDKSFLRVPIKRYHIRKSHDSKGIEEGRNGLKIYDIRKMVE
jgi:hypothetical protein